MKKIKVNTNNERIDSYLSDELSISRSKVQKLIKQEKVFVNTEVIMNNNYKIKEDDIIEVDDDLDFEIKIEAQDIYVDIIYEDDYLMIINKESGMVTHPGAGNWSDTLVNALYHKLDTKNEKVRPGIVHRLDKDTSGLMVVAKDEDTLEKLSLMIKERKIERKYLALTEGIFHHQTGTIDAPIGRDIHNKIKMTVTSLNSKHAITHFKVLKTYKDMSLLECTLDTGRTHQIRVHMEYINHEIYNDPIYNKSKHTTDFGQFLHSMSIKFIHPITKEEINIKQDPPKEFMDKLEELERSIKE